MPRTASTDQQTLRRARYEQLCEDHGGDVPSSGTFIEQYALIVGDHDNYSWVSMAATEQDAIQDLAAALNQESYFSNASPGGIYDLDVDPEEGDGKGIRFTVNVTVTTDNARASVERSFPE